MFSDLLGECAVDVGGGGLFDFDGAMERVSAWKGRIDRLADDTKTMSDRLRDLRVTAVDENRLVEVSVDASGALVDLRLAQRVQRIAPEVLARTIMRTVGQARTKLDERSKEIIADTLGTESAAARAVAARVAQQLRPVDPDDRGRR
jgi:DNA-binding protein YbaB